MRNVVFASAGTARSPRPNVTEASDSSIAIGAALSAIGIPWKSEAGCMRIMDKVHASQMPAKLGFEINDFAKCRRPLRIPFGQLPRKSACN
jgi:hypothetical protein